MSASSDLDGLRERLRLRRQVWAGLTRPTERELLVARLHRRLALGWPRLLVGAMVALTGLAGFLASVVLLHLGVASMGLRYALAVAVAYGAFLLQLRLWLAAQRRAAERRRAGRREVDPFDLVDGTSAVGELVEDAALPRWTGGGGSFHGGGASGTWEPGAGVRGAALHGPGSPGAGGPALPDLDLDLEGWAVAVAVVLAAIAAGGVLLAGAWVIWGAPALLAEVLFDFLVSAEVYRRLRHAQRAWWESALSHTWTPALIALVLVGACGLALDGAVPEADSIGGVVRALLARAS